MKTQENCLKKKWNLKLPLNLTKSQLDPALLPFLSSLSHLFPFQQQFQEPIFQDQSRNLVRVLLLLLLLLLPLLLLPRLLLPSPSSSCTHQVDTAKSFFDDSFNPCNFAFLIIAIRPLLFQIFHSSPHSSLKDFSTRSTQLLQQKRCNQTPEPLDRALLMVMFFCLPCPEQ